MADVRARSDMQIPEHQANFLLKSNLCHEFKGLSGEKSRAAAMIRRSDGAIRQ